MFCRKCGKKLLDDSMFCQYCGTRIDMSTGKHKANFVPGKNYRCWRDFLKSNKLESDDQLFYEGEFQAASDLGVVFVKSQYITFEDGTMVGFKPLTEHIDKEGFKWFDLGFYQVNPDKTITDLGLTIPGDIMEFSVQDGIAYIKWYNPDDNKVRETKRELYLD